MLSTLGKFESEVCNFSFDRLHKACFSIPKCWDAFLLAPIKTTQAFNNNKASVLTSLSPIANELIRSLELRFVMRSFSLLKDFAKQLPSCRLGMTGVIERQLPSNINAKVQGYQDARGSRRHERGGTF